MLDRERPHGGSVVVPDFLLLGVETHALADEGRGRAVGAPDCEGHLEAHDEDAVGGELGGAGAEGVGFLEGFP